MTPEALSCYGANSFANIIIRNLRGYDIRLRARIRAIQHSK
jgi:hypothetical protein